MATPVIIASHTGDPFWFTAIPRIAAATSVSAVVPTAKVLRGGIVGTAYSETITAQGGTAPYTFSVSAGSLPDGMSLEGSTGVISGTPTTVETSNFTIEATDANSAVGSTDFEISVKAASSGASIFGWSG